LLIEASQAGGMMLSVKIIDRVALSHPVLTGISRDHLGGLIEELADP
jgi:hypothetical protein